MKKLSKGMKAGLLIEILALILMFACIAFKRPVPDLIMWIFCGGLIVTMIAGFVALKRRSSL